MKTYEANETACDVVRDYMELIEFLQEMNDDISVETASYMEWAAMEILDRLTKNKAIPPITVIETFGEEVARYITYNKKAEKMFSAAVEVSDNIIDYLISQ